MLSNKYVDTSIQKGGVPDVPGYIEHSFMFWEAIQKAKRRRLSLYVVWLDLANEYGSVPHQHIMEDVGDPSCAGSCSSIIQMYFDGFVMTGSSPRCTQQSGFLWS